MFDFEVLSPSQIEDEIGLEVMRTMDPYWQLEEKSISSFQAAFSRNRDQALVNDELPSVLKDVEKTADIETLRAMRSQPVMKWCGDSAVKDLTATIEVLTKLREGSTSCCAMMTSELLASVQKKLSWFCKYEELAEEGKGTGSKTSFGNEAAAKMLLDFVSKVEQKVSTEADVTSMRKFSFLLSPGGLQQFGEQTEKHRTQKGGVAGAKPSESTSAGSAGGAASAAKGEEPAHVDLDSWSFFQ